MALVWEWTTEFNYTSGKTTGYQHRLEIIDTQGGISGEFKGLVPDGVVVRTEGSSRSLWQTVQSQSLECTMIIENSTHLDFIQALTLGQEYRFIVRYFKAGNQIFVGTIFVDEVVLSREQDVLRSGSYEGHGYYTITATNTIGLLQQIPYVADDGEPYIWSNIRFPIVSGYAKTTRECINYHIGNCLRRLPEKIRAYLPATPVLIATNWNADVGGTPWMEHISIDHRVFQEKGRNEGIRPWTCFEVLKSICEAFDMRVITLGGFLGGRFYFEQINIRQFGATVYGYQIDGTPVGGVATAAGQVGRAITCDGNLWRLSPDTRAYKPPLRSSTVYFETGINANFLFGKKFEATDTSQYCTGELGPVPIKNAETVLRLKGNIEFIINDDFGYLDKVRPVWYFVIKVGSYYYSRPLIDPTEFYNPTIPPFETSYYDEEEWTLTSSEYIHIYGPGQLNPFRLGTGKKLVEPIWFVTKPLPQSEDGEPLEFCFRWEMRDSDNNLVPLSALTFQTKWQDADLVVLDSDDNIVEQIGIDTVIINDPSNTRDIGRTIAFSDGFNDSSENILTDDQNPWTKTALWSGDQGSFRHYELLARTIMSRGMLVQEYLEGEIRGPYSPEDNLLYDGGLWVFMQGEYKSYNETWNAEWIKLQIGSAGALDKGEEQIYQETGGPGGNTSVISLAGITPHRKLIYGANTSLDVDALGIPVPDTTGWTDDQIAARVHVFRNGVKNKYVAAATEIDEWYWDNGTREIVFGEQTRTGDWVEVLVWT